jgi:hypothetical protein
MTSKTEQLFLELCLLRLRYTQVEIERVAQVREVLKDPALRNIVAALRELEAPRASSNNRSKPSEQKPLRFLQNPIEPQVSISGFVERLRAKRVLRTREQLDDFAQSIGVSGNFRDRQDLVRAIVNKLEEMPKAQAIQKISGIDRNSRSDSSAFVDLARTIMKS